MVPPPYVALFDQISAQRGDSSVVLPFPIWREAFINDADAATAQKAYDILNPHPVRTFSDKISLKTNPADMQIGKSYVNCTEDASMPHSYPWHPRLSEKLANALRHLIGDAGDDHAAIAVTHKDDVLQIFLRQIIDDRLDRLGEPNGFGITRPVAGNRRRVHLVARRADRSRGRLKLCASVPSAVDKHISRHIAFLPLVLVSNGPFALTTITKAGERDYRHDS